MTRNGYADLDIVLHRIFDRRIDGKLQDWADQGIIRADGSLKVARFADAWPKGQYYVWQPYFLPDPMVTTGAASAGTVHTHPVPRPIQLRPPTPVTTVLVIFINDGTDPVVMGMLVNS